MIDGVETWSEQRPVGGDEFGCRDGYSPGCLGIKAVVLLKVLSCLSGPLVLERYGFCHFIQFGNCISAYDLDAIKGQKTEKYRSKKLYIKLLSCPLPSFSAVTTR